MIAHFLGVRVWELPKVAAHYQDEAAVILRASYEARLEIAKNAKVSPEKVILPEY
jgi:hypothetical protein